MGFLQVSNYTHSVPSCSTVYQIQKIMCGLFGIFIDACFGQVFKYISEKINSLNTSEDENLSLLDRHCENEDILAENLSSGFDTALDLGNFIKNTLFYLLLNLFWLKNFNLISTHIRVNFLIQQEYL